MSTKIQSIYEKMLQNPKNRIKTQIKQPTPYEDLGIKDPNLTLESKDVNVLTPEEEDMINAIDKRMEMRKKGLDPGSINTSSVDESRIQKLEDQIKEIQETLIHLMNTHMKLLEKNG